MYKNIIMKLCLHSLKGKGKAMESRYINKYQQVSPKRFLKLTRSKSKLSKIIKELSSISRRLAKEDNPRYIRILHQRSKSLMRIRMLSTL